MTSLRDVMTPDPICLEATATIVEAAKAMRDAEVGDVIVVEDGRVRGIVTDRDITVRAVAEARECASVHLGDICSQHLVTLAPGDSTDDAIQLMGEMALRRIPVVENGRAVGIVSLGDLAIELEPRSVLAGISAAPATH